MVMLPMNAAYRWDLFWQIYILRDSLLPTERTLFVYVLHLFTEIGSLID